MRGDTASRPRRAAAAFRPECAEAELLAWLIGLPDGVDPARAALSALAAMRAVDEDCPRQSRLRVLLAEVSQYPAVALAKVGRRRSAARTC